MVPLAHSIGVLRIMVEGILEGSAMGCPKHAFIPVGVYFSIFGRHLAPPRASYIALIVLPTFLCLVSPRVTSLCVETAVAKCVSMETSRIWAMITSHSLVTSLFYDVTHPILLFPTEVYMGTPSSGALLRELWACTFVAFLKTQCPKAWSTDTSASTSIQPAEVLSSPQTTEDTCP